MNKKALILGAFALAMTTGVVDASAQQSMSNRQSAAMEDSIAPVKVTLGTDGKRVVTMSREQCIEVALQTNPTVVISDMEIKRMDYSKKETMASLFPQIDFSAAYQRALELQTISMSMGGQTQTIKMGSDNTWNFGFSASVPLIAPQLWKSLKLSDVQILAASEDARASRLDLVNNINKAYYSLLLAKSSYEVLRQNYDNAVFNADMYKKKFEVGTATEYDVLRSSVQVKNVEPELLQAEIAIKQAKLQLIILMGIENTVDIEPNISLSDLQQDMYGYLISLDTDLQNNTTLRTLDIQTDMLRETVNLKKLAWVPTLGASFNYNWSSISNGSPFKNQNFHPYSNVALALQIPIFSGGSKYYGLKQSQLQLQEMTWQRENLVNSLNMQVNLAKDNISKEIKQIDSSVEGMRQAKKAYEIMQKSFEIGAATYLDLRDSELANTSAQLAYYQAIYNYLISTSELDLLLGKENDAYMSIPSVWTKQQKK